MSAHYSIRRQAEGLAIPFGAWTVIAIGAVACAIVGLAIPMRWIESIAYQLYLDRVIAAAQPPMGLTARIAATLALAALGGAAGWLLARLFGVTGDGTTLAALLERLRGIRGDDEADAPALRAADRHPDAPARRPFSAARDIPGEDGWAAGVIPLVDAREEEEELLLDGTFASADDDEPPHPDVRSAPHPLSRPIAEWPDDNGDAAGIADPSFEPDLQDNEAGAERFFSPAPDSAGPAPADADPAVADAPPVVARPAPEPLDLSVARLDELIARLEAGISRRAGNDGGDGAQGESAHADPAFPHDPALAAALATLRKMERRAG